MQTIQNNPAKFLGNYTSLFLLLVVSLLIYATGLSGGFVVDDVPIIRDNPYLIGNHVSDFFSKGFWTNTAIADTSQAMYRPMVLVVFSLIHAIWGQNPFGYHALTLLIHLLNLVFVYILIRKLFPVSDIAAACGTSLFALHPARVESVAWISGITDPLVVLFLMLSLITHLSYTGQEKGRGYLVLSLVFYQLALWSKEVAIVFPLIVIAHDWISRKKINWTVVTWHTLLTIIYFAARKLALGTTDSQLSSFNFSQLSRALDFSLGYSELLVLPSQIPFYIRPPTQAVSSVAGWLSAIAIIALCLVALRFFKAARMKAFVFLAIWIIAFSWPAILIMFYMEGYFSARFLYVPSVGIALFLALLLDYLITNHPKLKKAALASFILLIAFYATMTLKEIPAWKNDGEIYKKVIRFAPNSAEGYLAAGNYWMGLENINAAEENFLNALKRANTEKNKVSSQVALGIIYGMAGKLTQSEYYLGEALKAEPRNSDALTGLGNLALMQGNLMMAINYYENATEGHPENLIAAENLAVAYEKTGQTERAESIRRRTHQMKH